MRSSTTCWPSDLAGRRRALPACGGPAAPQRKRAGRAPGADVVGSHAPYRLPVHRAGSVGAEPAHQAAVPHLARRRTAPSWCSSPRTARCSTARWTSPRRCRPDELARVQALPRRGDRAASRFRRSRTAWARAWRRRSATRSCAWRWTKCCRVCRRGDAVARPPPRRELASDEAGVQPVPGAAARHAGARGRHGACCKSWTMPPARATGTPSVRIGRENDAAALAGVSVVASRYGRGANRPASSPSSGPTRMDYSKVIAGGAHRERGAAGRVGLDTGAGASAAPSNEERYCESTMAKDLYEVLGVSREAPRRTRSRRRSDAARASFTPDVNKAPDAEDQFKELNEAYDVLYDAQQAQRSTIASARFPARPAAAAPTEAAATSTSRTCSAAASASATSSARFFGGRPRARGSSYAPARAATWAWACASRWRRWPRAPRRRSSTTAWRRAPTATASGLGPDGREITCPDCRGQGRVVTGPAHLPRRHADGHHVQDLRRHRPHRSRTRAPSARGRAACPTASASPSRCPWASATPQQLRLSGFGEAGMHGARRRATSSSRCRIQPARVLRARRRPPARARERVHRAGRPRRRDRDRRHLRGREGAGAHPRGLPERAGGAREGLRHAEVPQRRRAATCTCT